MISVELVESRKTILTTEIQDVQQRIAQLDQEKITLIANVNAMRGAIQQCDYFLGLLAEEEVEEDNEDKEDG